MMTKTVVSLPLSLSRSQHNKPYGPIVPNLPRKIKPVNSRVILVCSQARRYETSRIQRRVGVTRRSKTQKDDKIIIF